MLGFEYELDEGAEVAFGAGAAGAGLDADFDELPHEEEPEDRLDELLDRELELNPLDFASTCEPKQRTEKASTFRNDANFMMYVIMYGCYSSIESDVGCGH